MNARAIRAKIKNYLKRRAGDRLVRLPEAIRQHGETGLTPTDPVAKAYIALTAAAVSAMNTTIGGGAEHDAACQNFQEKYESWQQALREAEL